MMDDGSMVNGHALAPAVRSQLDDAPAEVVRLEHAIAAATRRAEAARRRVASREDAARAALRAELSAARDVIRELERRHRDALALLGDATDAEIASIEAQVAARIAGMCDPATKHDGSVHDAR